MTPTVVELSEYDEREVMLGAAVERRLRLAALDRLTVSPVNEGAFRIKAGSHIGSITTPGITVIIRPKVETSTVLYLLEPDGVALRLDAADSRLLDSQDLAPAVATLFARQLERLVGRGVVHGYHLEEEELSAVRGRIDVARQLRRGGIALPIPCRYDDYVADTRLNRRVRGAVLRLLRLPGVVATTAHRLRRLLAAFDQVGDPTAADLVLPSRFSRLDEHYRPIDALATLVLRHASVDTRAGSTAVSAFTVDMNVVFESFVAVRLRRLLTGRLRVDGQRSHAFDRAGVARIRPDLMFSAPSGRLRYVADTKYKVTATGLGRDTDYYQLLAYTAALELDEGLLIYAAGQETMPREIVVGSRGTRLHSYSLSLDGGPTDVDRRMRTLADLIANRAAQQPVQ
ncbi:MAG TPA: hypothetical protein VFU36_18715 [Jatrophihabitans sp.]|nr:hypothetical protein [Jatrophihabitans sp.]